MTSLTDFLLARVAEDEAAARAASPGGWRFGDVESVAGGTLYDESRRIADIAYEQATDHDGSIVRHLLAPEADANGEHIARHDPARVLAECEAKRRIVERHTIDCYPGDEGDEYVCDHCRAQGWHPADVLCPDLLDLASVYADRPGYRAEWRP